MARSYARNGVWGWPLEAQEAKLRSQPFAFEEDHHYRDELSVARAKRPSHIDPVWLEQRNNGLLRRTGRKAPETIYVATLLALAVNDGPDLTCALLAAEARRATVVALDSGFTIEPGAGMAGANAAAKEWQRAYREARTRPGRAEGNRVAALKRRQRTMEKLKPVTLLWRSTKPDRPTAEQISDQAGLSVKTLYNELGRRPDVKKGKRG